MWYFQYVNPQDISGVSKYEIKIYRQNIYPEYKYYKLIGNVFLSFEAIFLNYLNLYEYIRLFCGHYVWVI